MAAARLHLRGGPEQILCEQAPQPQPGLGDALVRVYAAGITPTELSWGSTYTARDGSPRLPTIPSHEFAGVIAAVGEGTSGVVIGDAVYAVADFWRDGAAAEYIVVRAADLAPMPRSLDPVHAAAMPLSALTAWQALVVRGGLTAGQRVLVHGGAGGVGSFAVQIAHTLGAYVLATAGARDTAFVRSLGADSVIDYAVTPFEQTAHDVDIVLDTVGGETLERSWAVLKRGGVLASTVALPSPEQAAQRGARGIFFVVEPDRGMLLALAGLADAGRLRPNVAMVMPLARAREAYVRGLAGHTRGKIVLSVTE